MEACIELEYYSPAELPGKLLHALGGALVSVTQPIHPYHRGKSGKVWFPFWRIIGPYHGDSFIGIIYDDGWFHGWREDPGDKLGKTAGLALLIWGSCELSDDETFPSVSVTDENYEAPASTRWDWGTATPVGDEGEHVSRPGLPEFLNTKSNESM